MANLRVLSIEILNALRIDGKPLTADLDNTALEAFKDQDINTVLDVKTGNSALHCIMETLPLAGDGLGLVNSCYQLLNAGADVNLSDAQGRTPLMKLASKFLFKCSNDKDIPYSIIRGFDCNMWFHEVLGDESLTMFDHLKFRVLELMLNYNLNILKKDKHHKTALDYAFNEDSVQKRKSNGLEDKFLCRLLELFLPSMREDELYRQCIKQLRRQKAGQGDSTHNASIGDFLTNQTLHQSAPDVQARYLLAEERQAYKEFINRGHFMLHQFKTELKAVQAREQKQVKQIDELRLELERVKAEVSSLGSISA